jgi:hypothetical protein
MSQGPGRIAPPRKSPAGEIRLTVVDRDLERQVGMTDPPLPNHAVPRGGGRGDGGFQPDGSRLVHARHEQKRGPRCHRIQPAVEVFAAEFPAQKILPPTDLGQGSGAARSRDDRELEPGVAHVGHEQRLA